MTPTVDEPFNDRELAERAAAMTPPALSAETLARIIARREHGERVSLPLGNEVASAARRRRWKITTTLSAIAATVIAVLVLQHRAPASRAPSAADAIAFASADSACESFQGGSDPSALRHLMVSAFGVAVACGAEPVPSPPIEVDGSQIVAATLVYGSRTVTDDAFTSEHAPSTFVITHRVWNGVPALLAVRTGPLITHVSVDSLTVAVHDLIPLHWASWYPTQKPVGSMHADFDSSSVSFVLAGRVDTAGRFPYAQAAGRLPWEWTKVLVIPGLKLSQGWRGTIQLAAPFHPHVHREFTQAWATIPLRVIGRETITVPAGKFDCWKLSAGPTDYESTVWVSTENHFVVKSRSAHRFGDTEFDDTIYLESAAIVAR